MLNGYVKLWRQVSKWEWYQSSETFHLFFHLVLNANYKDSRYMGHIIKRGEIVTGIFKLSQQTGMSIQTVRTCIDRLKSTNEITSKSTNKFTIITVCNYDTYNSNCEDDNTEINNEINKQLTNDQQTTNKQLTTSEELKNIRNKEDIYIDLFPVITSVNGVEDECVINQKKNAEEIYKLYPTRDVNNNNRPTGKGRTKDIPKIISLLKKGVDVKTSIESYLNECKRTKTFLKNFSSLLNNLPDVADEQHQTKDVPDYIEKFLNTVDEPKVEKPKYKGWDER